MDDRGDDDDRVGKIIVDGLFGIANEENAHEINTVQSDAIHMEVEYDTKINQENSEENVSKDSVLSDEHKASCVKKTVMSDIDLKTQNTPDNSNFSDEIQMKTATEITITEKLCKENEPSRSILSDENVFNEKNNYRSTVEADSNNFGSHVLCSNPDSDKLEIQPSFALISENYQKSRKVYVSNETIVSLENQTDCHQPSESSATTSVVLQKGKLPSTLSMISTNYQDSSPDDSDSNDGISINYAVDSDEEHSVISTVKEEPVKTRGELEISDLPPIEDLKISVEEDECRPVGCIKSIVNTLVVVEAFLNQPALDIDSVLFVDRGKRALGRIFDVFGPVNKPYYAVRFNDSEHIQKFDIQIKEPVYCAPRTEYASFVLVSQLMKMKGSDASWKHNNEPPCEFLDYSDDEAEKLARRRRRRKKCANLEDSDSRKREKSPDFPAKNIAKKPTATTSNSSPRDRSSNRRPSTRSPDRYSPHPSNMYSPRPPNYYYGPRQFPTYAQHLSSMDYSRTYRQPYHPYYYDPMYLPRHSYPYPYPYRPPGYNYRSRQPIDPDDPNQYHQSDYDYE